jgi:pimeloyl-ACP methyl ester carboxylesterase
MMARVLTAAIRELVGQRAVTLAGHSTGGFAALAIAAHTPDLAGRVVSISGFAQGQWTGALGFYQKLMRWGKAGKWLFKIIYSLVARSTRWRFRAAWSIYLADKKAFYTYPHIEAVFQATHPAFKHLDMNAMAQYFGAMPGIDISSLLPRITAPTLALSGDSDPSVPPAQARLIAERVPGADLSMIQGGGHILFAERPAAYRRALGDWLHKTSNLGE